MCWPEAKFMNEHNVDVSGHNLESSQTRGFFYGFLKLSGIRFSSLLLYRNCKRLREFEEVEISSKAVEVTVNNKEENS